VAPRGLTDVLLRQDAIKVKQNRALKGDDTGWEVQPES